MHRSLKKDTTLLFVRHGESTANIGTTIGGVDSLLTDQGEQQADRLNEYLLRNPLKIKPDAVFSSHFPRALGTATRILPGLGITCDQLIIDKDLCEILRGDWDGQERHEVYDAARQEEMDFFDMDHPAPNGESMSDVAYRMRHFLFRLNGRETDSERPFYVVVSHGIAIKSLLQRLFGFHSALAWQMALTNTGLTKISCSSKGWRLIYHNATPHLERPL